MVPWLDSGSRAYGIAVTFSSPALRQGCLGCGRQAAACTRPRLLVTNASPCILPLPPVLSSRSTELASGPALDRGLMRHTPVACIFLRFGVARGLSALLR